MVSKQLILGAVLVLAGGAALFAVATNDSTQASGTQTDQKDTASAVAKPAVQPLTADIATEERLLAKKQREREAHTKKMQEAAAALLKEQEAARKNALDKANFERVGGRPDSQQLASAENAARSEMIAIPSVQTRPEAIEAKKAAEEAKKAAEAAKEAERQAARAQAGEKKPETKSETKPEAKKAEEKKPDVSKVPARAGEYTVQAGETWQGIANRHGVPVTALAEANGMTRFDMLRVDRTIKIPSASQIARLERDGRAREAKRTNAKPEAKPETKPEQKKAAETTKTNDKRTGLNQNPHLSGRYTVQVAITSDRAKVDKLVREYRAAGYTVNTSNTSRGTRIIIGNEASESGARTLRGRIAADSRVSSEGAFVHKVQ